MLFVSRIILSILSKSTFSGTQLKEQDLQALELVEF